MSRKITAERDRLKETLNAERARSAKTFREMREEIIDLQSEIRRLKRSDVRRDIVDELVRCLGYVRCSECGRLYREPPCMLADHLEAFEAINEATP